MKSRQRKFRDGEVIFKEGDPSRTAFVILEGAIELTKNGPNGPVQLAYLKEGEMFGEMGLLDDSVRSATATALGKVELDVIARDDFLRNVQENPALAAQVMEKLAERLRAADQQLANLGEPRAAADVRQTAVTRTVKNRPMKPIRPKKPGFFARLLGKDDETRQSTIEVMVAGLQNDTDNAAAKRIAETLKPQAGMRVRLHGKPLQRAEEGSITAQLPHVILRARKLLAEGDADVMVWGEVRADGRILRLRFVALIDEFEDRPGIMSRNAFLDIPASLEGQLPAMLAATILSVVVPRVEVQKTYILSTLPTLLETARRIGRKPPLDLDKDGQGSFQSCYGNACANTGFMAGDKALLEEAEAAFEGAIRTLSRTDGRTDWALVSKNMGAVQQALGEWTKSAKLLEKAADTYRTALTVLTANDFPLEWAVVQNRLGLILYKLDNKSGESNNLKEAYSCFQRALQVVTMRDLPFKWAEAKHNTSLILQLLGGQARSEEILGRAVEAALDALEVRRRDLYPNLWATSANALGGAQFLLGKLTEDRETLEGAREAFQGVVEVYRSSGATKAANVAQRNLARVEETLSLLGSADEHRPAKYNWSEAGSVLEVNDDD